MLGNLMGVFTLPLILALVFFLVQIMEAIYGNGTGEEKKKKSIEAILKLFEMMKWNMPPTIKDNLGLFIDWMVWLFNSLIGFFSHGSTPQK